MDAMLTKIGQSSTSVSYVEALFTLIMQQAKSTRKALIERLLLEESETAEQILLKSSLQRGWEQVKMMEQSGQDNGSLQELIDELQ